MKLLIGMLCILLLLSLALWAARCGEEAIEDTMPRPLMLERRPAQRVLPTGDE